MDFSKLVEIREKRDLSQRKVANILKVSKSTYARWETGEQIIPLNHLNDFCNYFKVSMDFVLRVNLRNDYNLNDYSKELDKYKIGKILNNIRKKHKLTQKDIADILNTSQSTISSYERGETLVLTIFIYNIAHKFNYSVDKLCGRRKSRDYIGV